MLKNIGSNWALNVLQILVFMVLSPFVVRTLGRDVNGVWQSIVALAGPLQLLILGVPMASVRYIAEHVSKGDDERANAAISTCLAICLTMGAIAFVTGLGLFFLFESKYLGSASWAGLSADTISDARIAFGVFVLTVTLGFAARLPYGIFDAHHDFITRNLIFAAGLLLKLSLTLFLLSRDASLVLLAIVQITCMAVEFSIALALVKRRYPALRFGLRAFDRSVVRDILSFSVFAMLLNVGAQLAFRTDALVIGWFKTPEDVTIYDIGNKIFEPFTNLVLGIGMVVMPMATALRARSQEHELEHVFEKWTKISFTLVLAIGLYLVVLGPEFLAWWFGPDYVAESGLLLQVLMLSFLVFLPVRGVALPLLMGLGKPNRPALALLVMGVVNVGASIALIRPFGLLGVALGTAIPNVFFAGFVFHAACSELNVKASKLLRYAGGRALIGALPALAVLCALKWGLHVEGFVPLFASGLAFVGLFALAQVLFVYRGDPHVDLYQKIAGKLRPAPREPGRVSTLATLGWIAAAAVVTFVVAELAARAWLRWRNEYWVWTPYRRIHMEIDRETLPSLEEVVRLEINRDGERGPEPPDDWRDHYRVLVAGGSAAECYLLDQDSTWPAVLHRTLQEPANLGRLAARGVHVGSIARSLVPCWYIARMMELSLPRYAERLDVAVLMVGASDLVGWLEKKTPPTVEHGRLPTGSYFGQHPEGPFGWTPKRLALRRIAARIQQRFLRPIERRERAGKTIARNRAMRAAAETLLDTYADPTPMLASFEHDLRRVIEILQRSAERVVVVGQPWFDKDFTPEERAVMWNFGAGRPYEEAVKTYYTHRVGAELMGMVDAVAARVAHETGAEHVDLMPVLERSLETYYDFFHFTPQGAKVVGETVARAVLDRTPEK